MTTAQKMNVFICAAGHSGSTLLDLILGSHSDMVSMGEITQLPKNLSLNTSCTCGSPIRECTYWKHVLTLLAERLQLDITRDPYKLDLGFIDARVVVDHDNQTKWYEFRRKLVTGLTYLSWRYRLPNIAFFTNIFERAMKNNLTLYDCVREASNCHVVVDSTKHYMKAVGLYRSAPKSTKVILLTRDGRGVFYSNLKRQFGRKQSIRSWVKHFSRTLPLFANQLPASAVLQVRYEDLCRNPSSTLQVLCDFIGLDYENSMLDFSTHIHHIANGNDMRFINSSEIRCDELWREKLNAEDVKYFERYAWKLNRQLGYND